MTFFFLSYKIKNVNNIELMWSSIEKFDIINFYYISIFNLIDLSITNFFFSLNFVIIILISFFFFIFFSKILPTFTQIICEFLNKFLIDIIIKQIGFKGIIFFPLIFILFFFVLISNLLGIIPYNFPLTSHLIVTFFFSITIWFVAFFLGFYENGFFFLKIFVPNVPLYLLPFLVIIEILSYIIRIFSLALRLAANITSGHILLFTLAGFSIKLLKLNILCAYFLFFVLIFIFSLELGISFLQAYVFVTLACIYLNDSLNLSH